MMRTNGDYENKKEKNNNPDQKLTKLGKRTKADQYLLLLSVSVLFFSDYFLTLTRNACTSSLLLVSERFFLGRFRCAMRGLRCRGAALSHHRLRGDDVAVCSLWKQSIVALQVLGCEAAFLSLLIM
jgi:hypothetical protein